jgi:hypothetical protein
MASLTDFRYPNLASSSSSPVKTQPKASSLAQGPLAGGLKIRVAGFATATEKADGIPRYQKATKAHLQKQAHSTASSAARGSRYDRQPRKQTQPRTRNLTLEDSDFTTTFDLNDRADGPRVTQGSAEVASAGKQRQGPGAAPTFKVGAPQQRPKEHAFEPTETESNLDLQHLLDEPLDTVEIGVDAANQEAQVQQEPAGAPFGPPPSRVSGSRADSPPQPGQHPLPTRTVGSFQGFQQSK